MDVGGECVSGMAELVVGGCRGVSCAWVLVVKGCLV